MYITNANGCRYEVLAVVKRGKSNRYFLAQLRDDGSVVQYVIAYDYNKISQDWAYGSYGFCRADMQNYFADSAHDLLTYDLDNDLY